MRDTVTDPIDWIDTLPTIENGKSRAWQVDIGRLRHPVLQRHPCIALWLIEAPWAHALWHSYILSLAKLTVIDERGTPAADINAASHEIVLFALDPHYRRQTLLDAIEVHELAPPCFVGQFHEVATGEAVQRVRLVVQSICAGLLSPDTAARVQWTALFGANMISPGASG